MGKALLIDDLALKGWKEVLEKAVLKETLSLDYALSYEMALEKIEESYELIFLDIRLTEKDHLESNFENFTGFKILKKIKKDFLSANFSTPIILLTASNKIWNIEAFKQYGVDEFYIKEHPDYIFDSEFSKENLNTLQNNYSILLELSKKRKEIWFHCKEIIERLQEHPYFQNDKRYVNIKKRIEDKVKLGFGGLFNKITSLEKDILKQNNESLSFIVFWSILEELSKGYTDITKTWTLNKNNGQHEYTGNWKYRNGVFFIKRLKNNTFQIFYNPDSKKEFESNSEMYQKGHLSLSLQIYNLLAAYIQEEDRNTQITRFKTINKYRNEVDYIHSSVNQIIQKTLISKVDSEKAFKMNVKVLRLIKDILNVNLG